MKTSLLKLAGAALLAFALSTTVKADPYINGVLNFTGSVAFDAATLGSVTTVTSWTVVTQGPGSGSFSSVAGGTSVAVPPSWNFWDGDANTGAVANFWSVGGFTFNLTDAVVLIRTDDDGIPGSHQPWLLIAGNGSVSAAGYATTLGTFTFSTQGSSGGDNNFSFSASNTVPDGGTTALLVGLGLVGMSVVARRRK